MKIIIGSHVSYKSNNQLLGSVEEALSYGANTFMFYTGAPQNTKRGAINDEYTYMAYKLMKKNNMELENVIVHAPYIVNLCNDKNFDFSVSFLKQEVIRCESRIDAFCRTASCKIIEGSEVGKQRHPCQ